MAPRLSDMIREITDKIAELQSMQNINSDQVLELMNMFDDGKEYELDSTFETIKQKINDILDFETLMNYDGVVITPSMLLALMLCDRVLDCRSTSIHELYDSSGESLRFTTMDVDLANMETINIAVVE